MNDVTIFRGDSSVLNVTVTNIVGAAFDLTGTTEITFTMRQLETGAMLLQKTLGTGVTITPPVTAGIFTVAIAPADTESLAGVKIYDIEVEIAGEVYTVVKATVTITEDVTL